MKPLVILTGPTSVGKTDTAVALAQKINGEIISADSMQVYKYMDIGTAKVTEEEKKGVKHYLIDELEPEEEFNIVRFKELAKKAIEEIYAKGKIPIIAGGTGFYIQSVLYDIDFENEEEKGDLAYKDMLLKLSCENEIDKLYEMLMEVDPDATKTIHKNNVKRVIRALEFYHNTGKQISKHNEEQQKKESPYNYIYLVLNDDRDKLYQRIDKRVDKMIASGLVKEVSELKSRGLSRQNTSMQGIGYKEIIDYLDGEISLDEAVYIIKRDTRHFAKRQLTWFRREKAVVMLDWDKFDIEYDVDKMSDIIIDLLKERGIL